MSTMSWGSLVYSLAPIFGPLPQEIMGPTTTNKESSMSTIKVINLLKLMEDGSNWVMYQKCVKNAIIVMVASFHLLSNRNLVI